MSETVGYVTLAKRPEMHREDREFDYQPAGSVWPTFEPADNHAHYCQAKATAEPDRYGGLDCYRLVTIYGEPIGARLDGGALHNAPDPLRNRRR